MSSFEIGASRPVGAVQLNPVAAAAAQPATAPAAAPAQAAPPVETAVASGAGQVPFDQTRVDQIRQAVDTGTFPLIPAKVGDAMIAAGILLQRKS